MTLASWPDWPERPEPGNPDRPSPPGWPDEPGYPYPPMRPTPRREGPLMVPMVDMPGDASSQLFARRRVLLSGPLDHETATRVAAELMALDGRSGDDVELAVNSGGGRLADVVPLLDVIASMRARVATVCLGRATGTAAVLLACGTGRRRAAAHAMIALRCSEPERVEGPPAALRQQLEELDLIRRHIVAALVDATGRPAEDLEVQLDSGPFLDRQGAAELGLIDPADE